MPLPPLREENDRAVGDAAGRQGSPHKLCPGDEAFAALDALAERFNLQAFAEGRRLTRGSAHPTPADLLVFGVTTPGSILKLSPEASAKSGKMRPALQRLVTDPTVPPDETDATLVKLCKETHKRPELRDELLLAALALTRGCDLTDPLVCMRAWDIMHCVCASVTPTETFAPFLGDYLGRCAGDQKPTFAGAAQKQLVQKAFAAHKRCAKNGVRRHPVDCELFSALRNDVRLTTRVYFLDDTFEEVPYDVLTTVGDATPSLALAIKLKEYKTFGLFASKRSLSLGGGGGDVGKDGNKSCDSEPNDGEKETERALKDHEYLVDVLLDFKKLPSGLPASANPNAASYQNNGGARKTPDALHAKLVFKKRMFREGDELVTDSVFVTLSYLQVKHDFLVGNYPVNPDDAVKLAAFQIAAEAGPGLERQTETLRDLRGCLPRFIPGSLLKQKSGTEWAREITQRHELIRNDSKEECKLSVLKMVRALPYGGALFFAVTKIEDPIGLLPGKVTLGVNKRGVHFFRPTPLTYLHSAELRDIMQFGSSQNAVFFKMRVAGVLHVFQFETACGEEVCVALQTHINDVMTKRYNETKDLGKKEGKVRGGGGVGGSDPDPATPKENGGRGGRGDRGGTNGSGGGGESPELRRVLVAANRKIEELSSERVSLRNERDGLREKLKELTKSFETKTETQADLFETQDSEMHALTLELSELRLRLGDAETQRLQSESTLGDSDTRVGVLQKRVAEITAARDSECEKARVADSQARTLERELHKLKTSAVDTSALDDLRETLEREKGSLTSRLAETDEKLKAVEFKFADAESELARVTRDLTSTSNELRELRLETESSKKDLQELSELREMKRDVERQDTQTAAIIHRQKQSLELLEVKYREESVLRKGLFNAIEDMKGKIRVYARTRPLSRKEIGEKQTFALVLPDQFTMEHAWKDEKKNRAYAFDKTFGAASTQDEVFQDTKYLVQSAFDGYNVCIFAYGQTGSGKTHTVYGDAENPGLTPRAMAEVTRIIAAGEKAGKFSVKTKAYMLELYQEQIGDLLLPAEQTKHPPKLEIKKDAKGWVTVPNATSVELTSKSDIMQIIDKGLKDRRTTSTKMNVESSRSHLIFSLVLETTDLQTQNVTRGKLSFVDLAGSERVKKSGAVGDTMKEAQAINKSLSALGDVISALADEKQHIPYRNHKLTMLMSDSLGGNAKTLMFVNVSPSDGNLEETHNSLTYATRVRTIKNSASKDVADKEMQRLRSALASWRQRAGELEAENMDIENCMQTEIVGDGLVARKSIPPAKGLAGGAGRLPNM